MARWMLIHAERRAGIRLVIGSLLLCTVFLKEKPAQAEKNEERCLPARNSTILKSRENELRATAEKLLRAFRDGDTKTFLGLVHPNYFSEGESRNYTLAELKRAFRVKDEMYCYLFDTSCIAPASGNNTPETSFSEVAKRPEAKIQSVEVTIGEHIKQPGCSGSVNFTWVDPFDAAHVSTFTFMYVSRQWKTVGFDFTPAAILDRGEEKPRTPPKRP
jgi:hypothetical protein